MTDCERWRLEMPGYLGSDLSEPERVGLEKHLAGCAGCTRVLAENQEVAALATTAAMEATPRPDLETDVFEWLTLEDVASLVATSPLEKDAPVDLERRALQRAGLFDRAPVLLGRWPRVAAALAPGLAAAAVVLAVIAVNVRSDQFAPPGERVQTFSFAGVGLTTPSLSGQGDVYDSGEGDYLVVVEGEGLSAPPGHHYEIWGSGEEGDVLFGSFKDAEVSPAILSVGVDPYEYPMVSIWLEEDDAEMKADGEVVMRASLHEGSPAPLQSTSP